MYIKLINGIISICVLGVILFVMPAMAQDQANPQVTYSDEKLESFIIASLNIHHLQEQAFSDMVNMESEQQKQKAAEKANQQMLQILQEAELTENEFIAIGNTVQTDPQLQEKVQKIASELHQSQ